MSKKSKDYSFVVLLAYLHRYLFPIMCIALPLIIAETEKQTFFVIGTMAIIFALYTLIGVILKWKHIFCSFQNAYHEKMTPNRVNWERIRKIDLYGVPCIFGLLGIACVICSL